MIPMMGTRRFVMWVFLARRFYTLDLPLRHVEVGVAEGEAVGPDGAIVGDLGGAEGDGAVGVGLDQLAAGLAEDAPALRLGVVLLVAR